MWNRYQGQIQPIGCLNPTQLLDDEFLPGWHNISLGAFHGRRAAVLATRMEIAKYRKLNVLCEGRILDLKLDQVLQ